MREHWVSVGSRLMAKPKQNKTKNQDKSGKYSSLWKLPRVHTHIYVRKGSVFILNRFYSYPRSAQLICLCLENSNNSTGFKENDKRRGNREGGGPVASTVEEYWDNKISCHIKFCPETK